MIGTLTNKQIAKLADLTNEYGAESLTIRGYIDSTLVVRLRDERKNTIRRIEINEKGQVTHIRAA